MHVIYEGMQGHVLEHPTADGKGMTSVLLKEIQSVSYKQFTMQKRKPNQEPDGEPELKTSLIFIAQGTQYGVDCTDLEEAKALYDSIKELI